MAYYNNRTRKSERKWGTYLPHLAKSLSENGEAPLVGPFDVCRRWRSGYSPLRGCARRTASTAIKNPFRWPLPHFQTGSKSSADAKIKTFAFLPPEASCHPDKFAGFNNYAPLCSIQSRFTSSARWKTSSSTHTSGIPSEWMIPSPNNAVVSLRRVQPIPSDCNRSLSD